MLNISKSLFNINTLLIFRPLMNDVDGKGHRRTNYRARSMHMAILTTGPAFAEMSKCLSSLGKA
jgi:hypothetical protein